MDYTWMEPPTGGNCSFGLYWYIQKGSIRHRHHAGRHVRASSSIRLALSYILIKPGLYSSRRLSLKVAQLGDSRRQSHARLYFSWRLSPAQVGDCRQQSLTVVCKVQQCWTFNSVVSSRWHFPSNQRAATAFNKITTHTDLKNTCY